ncbi:MAG: hypothetical protein IT235_04135 [Bacteroidia bacterium]|nr:hypothetical protein [Bacteroidia bacterium]
MRERFKHVFFHIAESSGVVNLPIKNFILVTTDKYDRRNKCVLMKDGRTVTLMNCKLEKLIELSEGRLYRANKSQLVAIEAVYKIEFDLITLSFNNHSNKPIQITLGREYRKQFK